MASQSSLGVALLLMLCVGALASTDNVKAVDSTEQFGFAQAAAQAGSGFGSFGGGSFAQAGAQSGGFGGFGGGSFANAGAQSGGFGGGSFANAGAQSGGFGGGSFARAGAQSGGFGGGSFAQASASSFGKKLLSLVDTAVAALQPSTSNGRRLAGTDNAKAVDSTEQFGFAQAAAQAGSGFGGFGGGSFAQAGAQSGGFGGFGGSFAQAGAQSGGFGGGSFAQAGAQSGGFGGGSFAQAGAQSGGFGGGSFAQAGASSFGKKLLSEAEGKTALKASYGSRKLLMRAGGLE